MKEINLILNQVLKNINPDEKEIFEIESYLRDFLKKFNSTLKDKKIKAQVFIGGSFAKKTLIKKGVYDIDVFIRFNEEYRGKDISRLTQEILNQIKVKDIIRVHGSRDYFRINASPSFFIELIPVLKVSNPKKAENITDLSYFHVSYINKKFKNSKIVEDVRLAKAFCHANECYGAESYINGFSGYALELVVYYYGGFLKFIKAVTKIKDKEIVDIEKSYKNKEEIIKNVNSAKLTSPIILIDPTYKERNALAALSQETFEVFKKACLNFLEKPSIKSFEKKEIDFEKLKKKAKNKNLEFVELQIETNKQEGDIAGSKLLKFYKYLTKEIEKYFKISYKNFRYDDQQKAYLFFVVKGREEIIFVGPGEKDEKNIQEFKKKHKKVYLKGKRYYATEKFDKKFKDFFNLWKMKNIKKLKEMSIIDTNLR